MRSFGSSPWKQAPFIRLTIFFSLGIILQSQYDRSLMFILLPMIPGCLAILLFPILRIRTRFNTRYITGISVLLLVCSLGSAFTWRQNVMHHRQWFGRFWNNNDILEIKIEEPLVEKPSSMKALASVQSIYRKDRRLQLQGKLIIYFAKEQLPHINYGSIILIRGPVQEIRNSGNPAAFDFRKFCLYQGITHQVYLRPNDFIVRKHSSINRLKAFLFNSGNRITSIIKKFIPSPREQGMAEALLIGYKNDLDKDLLQSYSNTGVVHVIAISGLHLGLIYWLLGLMLKPLSRISRIRWLTPLLIIIGLWLFSLLAGGQPSILRSTLMFTVLVIGQHVKRRTSIYNSLACSAFILLCINPFWLFDAAFLLSYSALLSILLFMKPIYALLYFPNPLVDWFWQLNAVTFAAQVLTLPVSIYFFHQLPVYFWLTNFLAVPLSTLVLFLLIMLCLFSFIPVFAKLLALLGTWLIIQMNAYIAQVESLPFAVWRSLQWSLPQVLCIYLAIAALAYGILEKKSFAKPILASLLFFMTLRSIDFIRARKQSFVLIYHISKLTAIDFVDGRHAYFAGDPSLKGPTPPALYNIIPARTMLRYNTSPEALHIMRKQNAFLFHRKRILILSGNNDLSGIPSDKPIDLLLLCGPAKFQLSTLPAPVSQIVADGSIREKQAELWRKEAIKLNIPFHYTMHGGAFVMNLP